jgi:hypothetical protein
VERVGGRDRLVVTPWGVRLDAETDVVDGVGRRAPQIVDRHDRARIEPGLSPATLEERNLGGGLGARLQSLELDALDVLARGQPRSLEVLRRWRVRPDQLVVVDRLEWASERTGHDAGRYSAGKR